jgi:SAM-dependent methyltransferase
MTAVHGDSIIALTKWLDTPVGRYATSWEQSQFDTVVADIFGYNAVQAGLLGLQALRNNRMPFVFGIDEFAANQLRLQEAAGQSAAEPPQDGVAGKPLLLARLEELPFSAQSLDLLVLPHALEFAEDPHQVLREAERVLIPEGQLIITGFNPASLWGARQALGRLVDAPFLPKAGQFLPLPRLKDWLKLLGFEANRGRFGCYRPPLRSQKWLERFSFMESAGDRWWSVCGAIYMVSAIKRVPGMRLIGAIKKDRKPAAAQLAPTAQRSGARHAASEVKEVCDV